jgi:4-aminobutyrate aminotransferase-like enzyme
MSGYKFNLIPQEVEHIKTKHRTICSKIPAPETLETLAILDKFESRSMHGQLPIVWENAKDFSIHDSVGNKWIDFTSTIFVANVGHSNSKVIEQVKSSLDENLVASYAYATRKKAEYCQRLVEFAGANFEKVFLLSSGTEATEAAVKLMKLNGNKFGKKKNQVLAISGNWHGRTMAAQLLSDNKSQRNWIQDSSEEVVHIPFPYPWLVNENSSVSFLESSLEKLETGGIDLSKDISGIMLETFQGWGAFFYPNSEPFDFQQAPASGRLVRQIW